MHVLLIEMAVAVLSLMVSTAAHADEIWTMNAGGCVPDNITATGQGYTVVTGGFRVKHKATNTNNIVLVCPITTTNPAAFLEPNRLKLYHANDGDGFGTNASITARLRSIDKRNGALALVCTATSTENGQWKENLCNTGTMDFINKYYWVQVTIHRSGTNFVPEFNMVELVGAVE